MSGVIGATSPNSSFVVAALDPAQRFMCAANYMLAQQGISVKSMLLSPSCGTNSSLAGQPGACHLATSTHSHCTRPRTRGTLTLPLACAISYRSYNRLTSVTAFVASRTCARRMPSVSVLPLELPSQSSAVWYELFTIKSPQLRYTMNYTLQESNNLYAECTLRSLGAEYKPPLTASHNAEQNGIAAVSAVRLSLSLSLTTSLDPRSRARNNTLPLLSYPISPLDSRKRRCRRDGV